MNIVYAFIGPLPAYCIDTVHQTRLFFDGPIYFIINDMGSSFIPTLRDKYNVTIIPYSDVEDKSFYKDIVNPYRHKFVIVPGLKGREGLFIHSFERFFLLNNLMKLHTLSNVFFMELDNLVYEDPRVWLDTMSIKDMAYMFDNINRCSSGIAYIKSTPVLELFLQDCKTFITTTTEFITEMTVLYTFWESHKDRVQLLPVYWTDSSHPSQANETFPLYNTLFDALPVGCMLGGIDPHHTNGVIKKGGRILWSYHNFTQYTYRWLKDERGRLVPSILNPTTSEWIRINNLHVHSKDLKSCISIPL